MPEVITLNDDPRIHLRVSVLGLECDGLLNFGSWCTIMGKEGLDIVKYFNLPIIIVGWPKEQLIEHYTLRCVK